MSLRAFPVLVLALFAAARLGADETSVRAEVDARKVGLDDQFELRVVVDGNANVTEAPVPSALKNLRVLGGPAVSQQVSLVNGAFSQSRIFTYVLQAQAAGVAEIGPIRVKLGTTEATTARIPLEVVAGSLLERRRPRDPFGGDPFGDDPFGPLFGGGRRERRQAPPPKLLVEAIPARTHVHVGEPVLVTYAVLTQVSLSEVQYKDPPQYPGFWVEDLEQPKAPPGGEVVVRDGENFRRFPIAQKLVFPTRAGKLNIPAATLRLGVPRQSFFDSGSLSVERATQPITITAEPIPSEPGFSGAVGHFKAQASLDKTTLSLGEGATLRFELEGSGNLKWIDQGPEVHVAGAKVFPPQAKSNVKASSAGLSGTRTWEYVIVPETAGTLQIPSLPFSYFDPAAGRLVGMGTAPLTLQVEPGSGAPAAAGMPAARPAGTAAGVLSLRSDLDVRRSWLPGLSPATLGLALLLVLVAHAGMAGASHLAELRASRSGRAPARSARAALADLKRATRPGLSKEAAAAVIEKALHDVFGAVEDDTGPPADERERSARELLAEVHFIRYAPQLGDYSDKLRELAERAERAVRKWA